MNENDIIFWAVDCQKDFILPSGKLYIKGAESILLNLSRITSLANNKNITVVSTGDYHSKEDPEISNNPDYITTFPEHCLLFEEGSEFVNEAYPKLLKRNYYLIAPNNIGEIYKTAFNRSKDIILYKNVFDVFKGNKYTDEVLEILQPKTVVVYGVASNVCVNFAVLGLVKRGYKVLVVKDAIKELPNIPVDTIYKMWENLGVEFIVTSELEKLINEK